MASGRNDNKKGNGSGGGKWGEMLAFPPAILLPVLLIGLIGGKTSYGAGGSSTSLLASLILSYAALSIAYLTLLKQGHQKAAWGAALLADGILCLSVSSEFGTAAFLGWIGLALFLAGLMTSVTQLSPPPKPRFAKNNPNLLPDSIEKSDIKAMLSIVAFPAAFLETDDVGVERIAASNDAFAAILGRISDKLEGQAFSSVIPPDVEERTMTFADAEWVAHRTTKGKQTLFLLSPAVKAPERETPSSPRDIVDEETGLYTQYYMTYKAEADVQACRRYKRRLAVVLLKLSFESANLVQPSDDSKKYAFLCFARMVSVSVRACDTAYRVGDDEVLIFLPDIPQNGTKSVMGRLEANMRKLAAVECTDLAPAKLLDASVNLFGEELSSADEVVKEVYLVMNRNAKNQG